MKKIYILVTMFIVSSAVFGQLSGTKTIGGTAPDYPSIRAAFNDVSVKGVAAPGVTFTIRDGVYNEDSLVIRTATASAAAPIVVKPAAGAAVVINVAPISYSNRAALLIDSTKYVTIDGSNAGSTSRNMTINALGVIGSRGVRAINSSTNFSVKNCVVRTGWTAATDSTIYRCVEVTVTGGGKNCHNALIENNLLKNAGAGIMANGVSNTDSLLGLIIRNNIIDSVSSRGIYTYQGVMGSKIYNNDIAVNVGQSPGFNLYGIYLGGGCDFCRVYNNKLHDMDIAYSGSTASYGIAAILGTASQSHGGNVVYNNFVAMNITKSNGTGSIYPLYSEETLTDTMIFNSVKLTGSSTSTRRTNGYYNGVSKGSCVVMNNILINLRTDVGSQSCAIGRPSAATTPVLISDYNDLYIGSDTVGHKIGSFTNVTYFTTLADWQAGNATDGASISEDAPFVSATDLHIRKGVSTGLKNAGTPIPGYTTDIDGNKRSATNPDIGAHEVSAAASVERISTSIPASFAVDQNYPNPFNPSTTIRFSIASTQFVSITLADILGREVSTLVSETLTPGSYTVRWNAAGMPSGVYVYTIRSGNAVESRRMVLMK
ncbi:MAG: T9SS type A sorting domain-containing protein [Ignavibacteriales bacterium]|nr:T9SS type A sorting domain-containing protein [Ignavibacteriales bacterium]